MKRTPLIAELLVILALLLQGCIYDSTKDCPSLYRSVILNFYFTHNTQNIDLLQDELRKLDVFVYDSKGLLQRHIVDDKGPFVGGYSLQIDSLLEEESYRVVALGNLFADSELSGIERLSDAKVSVVAQTPEVAWETTAHGFVNTGLTTSFHGKVDVEGISTRATSSQTVDLMKNTNDVTVTISWKNDKGVYCTDISHEQNTRVYLEGKNGESDFDNQLQCERLLIYESDSLGKLNPDRAELKVLIRTMQLMVDGCTVILVVRQVQPDGTEKEVYSEGLVDMIKQTGQYNTQESLDRECNYDVDITFRCTEHTGDETWMATTIYINGWLIKNLGIEI